MSADAQGRQLIRKLKRENPDSKILVTGCYAQRAEKELASFPGVDYVIGNLNPEKFSLMSLIAGQTAQSDFPDFPMPSASPRTRPYIKIQEGCDARCSYCIIPAVRGRSRSLEIDEVLRRVDFYRDRGYKEMIFTGISMGGYGKDLDRHAGTSANLSALMKRVESLSGDFRIRLSSLEPEEIDDEFISVFTSSSRFQPHLHLPLQSASNRVLKKMRRQYLFERYDSIVQRIFAKVPDLNLGTDILVGFPGEDETAYRETFDYINSAPFGYLHVFPFSPRPDTPAAAFHQVDSLEIKERASDLRSISQLKNLEYRSRFIGRQLRALKLHGTNEALTDNYIRVQLPAQSPSSEILSVQIDSVFENATFAHVA